MKKYKLVVCKTCLLNANQREVYLIDEAAPLMLCAKHGDQAPIHVLGEYEVEP